MGSRETGLIMYRFDKTDLDFLGLDFLGVNTTAWDFLRDGFFVDETHVTIPATAYLDTDGEALSKTLVLSAPIQIFYMPL